MLFSSLTSDQTQSLGPLLRQAVEAMDAGELVVFPTETVYGLGCCATHDAAYEKLRSIKAVADRHPFTLHVADADHAAQYADLSIPLLHRLARKVLPGPFTLRVEMTDAQIDRAMSANKLPAAVRHRLYPDRTIALRSPDHPVAHALLSLCGTPVIATSAARPNDPVPFTAEQARANVGAHARLVIDGGECRYNKPSTVIHVKTVDGLPVISVEREGVHDQRYVRKLLRWTLLIVCSGNTCRSPMGEALARRMLAEKRGLKDGELEAAGLRVLSAGTSAASGFPPSAQAVEALDKLGIDLSGHRSRRLTRELIGESDLVLCMTASHLRAVLDLEPSAARRALLLDPAGDVEDPFGTEVEMYERTADQLRAGLEARLKEQQL